MCLLLIACTRLAKWLKEKNNNNKTKSAAGHHRPDPVSGHIFMHRFQCDSGAGWHSNTTIKGGFHMISSQQEVFYTCVAANPLAIWQKKKRKHKTVLLNQISSPKWNFSSEAIPEMSHFSLQRQLFSDFSETSDSGTETKTSPICRINSVLTKVKGVIVTSRNISHFMVFYI